MQYSITAKIYFSCWELLTSGISSNNCQKTSSLLSCQACYGSAGQDNQTMSVHKVDSNSFQNNEWCSFNTTSLITIDRFIFFAMAVQFIMQWIATWFTYLAISRVLSHKRISLHITLFTENTDLSVFLFRL